MSEFSPLTLDEFVNRIQQAQDSRDYVAAVRLMENNWTAVWFGFSADQLRPLLGSVIRSGLDEHGVARRLLLFVAPDEASGSEPEVNSLETIAPDPALVAMNYLAEVAQLRLQGQVMEADSLQTQSAAPLSSVNPIFDTEDGWNLFISVQSGITAMLAGKFGSALTHFAAAQFHVIVPTLSFLNRDAYVKSALVHAAFGDAEEARSSLAHAARIPRTVSWTEPLIDAHQSLAEVLVEQNGKKAASLLSSIPLHDVGELWPFYLVALHQVLEQTGRSHELAERISVLEQLPFPRIEGNGFNGSVFPLLRATIDMNRGNLGAAREFLAKADQSFVGTRSIAAGVELLDGRPQQAVEVIGKSESGRGLRRIELWKYAALARGYLNQSQEAQALEVLLEAHENLGTIRTEDLLYFSQPVRKFASESLAFWPTDPEPSVQTAKTSASGETARLTERELQIVTMMVQGIGRKEMSQKLFVSINTLKTHLTSIYKKLGVSNRSDAVRKATGEELV